MCRNHPDGLAFRISLLLTASGITVSANSLNHIYSILQPGITRTRGCSVLNGTAGNSCCLDCLGIGDFNYNIFHSMAYSIGILSPLVGFLHDKLGNSASVLILTSSVIGSSLIGLGSSLSPSWLTLPLLLAGAGLWGVGFLPATISRERLVGFWFKERNLRLAFGVSASVNRIPALLTFTLTERLRESVGLQLTLWLAALVCVFSLLCAVCASLLDARGIRQLGRADEIEREASEVGVFDLRHANFEFWLLLAGFSFFSSSIFTYMDNSTEFVNEKFGFTKSDAAASNGAMHYIGILMAPLASVIIDKVGRSSLFFIGASVTLLLGLSLLAFSNFHPAIGACVIGIAYSFVAPAVFASVPLVVPNACLGVATSLLVCGECLVQVLQHALIGWTLGSELRLPLSVRLHRWTLAMLVILANAFCAFAFAVALAVFSWLRRSACATYEEIDNSSQEERNSGESLALR